MYWSDNDKNDYYGETEEIEIIYDKKLSVKKGENLSCSDAFVKCLRDEGTVSLSYMSALSGLSEDELIGKLEGIAIWPDPDKYRISKEYYESFSTKQQIISGNLYRKLELVSGLHESTGLFENTLNLIKENLPDKVEAQEIHINPGSTWVPDKFIMDFVRKLLGMIAPPRIEYDDFQGKYTIMRICDPDKVRDTFVYGTDRMPALSIIKRILNATPVKVYDQIPREDGCGNESVLNQTETLAAQEKERIILEKWQDYVHGDSRIEAQLQDAYMEYYGYTISRYDGRFLDTPDLNRKIELYPHQKDAVARVILNNNSLIAHEVGSGKTLVYSVGCHELIRMGIARKALIVVPNATLAAIVRMYKSYYKDDKVLAVSPGKDFSPTTRVETLEAIKNGDYKIILMAYSSFDMITLSKGELVKKRRERLRDCRKHIEAAKSYNAKQSLQNEERRLNRELKKFEKNFRDTETACFESLGINVLVIDEAHNYKNITLENNSESIIGIHGKGSKKADNLLDKVEYIQQINGHVIFATGTPITNSLADLYVMQRYLQPDELKQCNIFHFNDWVNTFCSQTHSFEIDVDSKNFRFVTRFSRFHNLPELMSMFSGVCDFFRITGDELDLPTFNGYCNTLIKRSDIQKEYIDRLAERTEAIRRSEVNRKEDNLLKVTVDGRKCALDPRLVIQDAVVNKGETKVSVCSDTMAALYHNNPGTTQIAFSDISTPKEGFNIYMELKDQLIGKGVDPKEIAFVHEAETEKQRNDLEKRFNAGEIRILIGSTIKLGTGANVQQRLLAVHHLDVPWRPADMVQREGRIIRQGNINPEVFIYRYVTKASFDGYTWQILENKQRFISQFLSGSLNSVHRDESDCADTVLDYAEIKALAVGNPLIRERIEIANELEHARINQLRKRKELIGLQELIETIPEKIQENDKRIKSIELDNVLYKRKREVIPNEERQMFGEELIYALNNNIGKDKERVFSEYQGFRVILPKRMNAERPYVIVTRSGSNRYMVKMEGSSASGCCKRIDHLLIHLEDEKKRMIQNRENLVKQMENACMSFDEGNEYDEQVVRLTKKLKVIDDSLMEDKAV